MSHEKVKEMKEVELICADCGLPIAGEHPRTDVTRYLSETSRCQCHRNGNDKGKTSESNSASAASDSNSSSSSTSSQSPNKARSSTSAHLAMAVKVGFSLDDAAEVLGERFEVIDFLGQGGMGSVFKAREKSTGTIFAVKLLNPQLVHDEQSVRRFEQEAKAAMHLTHAHLTAVYEYGVGKDDTPYLVMDYLEGTTLETLLESENHLDSNRAINLFSQLCEAISYAHLKGVIHRDIKPANIMVMQRGEGVEYAKLFDFGIAKVLPNQAIDFTQDMTQTGDLYGSPLYMSPEQCKGLPLDERTDLYSLGCVIYKSITGKHPFEGKNFVDTVVKIITTEAAPASTVNPSEKLPKGLDQVVARCLAKDPAFRYRNASLLQDDLERVRDSKLISKMAGPPATLSAAYAATSKPAVNPRILALAIVLSVSIFGSVAKNIVSVRPTVQTAALNPRSDAENFDQKAYGYFINHQWAKAIPLLEFGLQEYKDNDPYLADNYNHIGKCYLGLQQYDKAVPNYQHSLKLYQKWGSTGYNQMPEAVTDYATVLTALGRQDAAKAMVQEFAKTKNLAEIP